MENISGIYRILNLINGKFYIGSSCNIRKRNRTHFNKLKNNKHTNSHLQSAYKIHGEENFKFEVIEYVEDIENLLMCEQYWIDKLDACNPKVGYNLSNIAGRPLSLKGRIVSEETRRKLSESLMGNSCSRGRILSKKHKQKISESHKGKIKSWAEGNLVKRKRVVRNIDTGEIFNSIKKAGDSVNLDYRHISNVCRGICKTCGGYKWEYYSGQAS